MGLVVKDHTREFEDAFRRQVRLALMECGAHAEGIAKALCPVATGRLHDSIVSEMDGDGKVVIGTNVEYAAFVELGTGSYSKEGGRKTPWAYKDENGQWHTTSGHEAQPYLRPAAEEHKGDYRRIIESRLQSAGYGGVDVSVD